MKNRYSSLFSLPLVISYIQAIVVASGSEFVVANEDEFWDDWPEASDPVTVGDRIAEEWLTRPFQFEIGTKHQKVIYPEVCTWYGSMEVARLSGNESLLAELVERFDRFRGNDAVYVSKKRHVDDSIFGIIPLEIYLISGDETALDMGEYYAKRQWENPDSQGLSTECRFWIDDLYMLPILQVQAYRATGNLEYLNRAARTCSAYFEVLQQPNGLFYHASDSPFYWGRGNGWVAAGVAELLRDLPPENTYYDTVVAGFKKMMGTLAQSQAPSGLWRQLVDDPESWEETSSSGMFTFAMITGVKIGLLEPEVYGPLARRGWLALVRQITDDGHVKEVCIGTNKAAKVVGSDLGVQRTFYLERPRKSGDLHGQAPVLWCAAALLR